MVSHRSGETEDTFISDLVVGLCTGQVHRQAGRQTDRLVHHKDLNNYKTKMIL